MKRLLFALCIMLVVVILAGCVDSDSFNDEELNPIKAGESVVSQFDPASVEEELNSNNNNNASLTQEFIGTSG